MLSGDFICNENRQLVFQPLKKTGVSHPLEIVRITLPIMSLQSKNYGCAALSASFG